MRSKVNLEECNIDWKKTNEQIGFELGCCANLISEYRRKLNIKHPKRFPSHHIDWDLVPFNHYNCTTIGAMLGICYHTVVKQKRKSKIKQTKDKFIDEFDWDKVKQSHELKKWSQTKSKINWDKVEFGTITDVELAKKLKCSQPAIVYQRKKRGILPFKSPETIIDWSKLNLGKKPDSEIAAANSISVFAVKQKRIELNILSYHDFIVQQHYNTLPFGIISDKKIAENDKKSYSRISTLRRFRFIPTIKEQNLGTYVELYVKLNGIAYKAMNRDTQNIICKNQNGEIIINRKNNKYFTINNEEVKLCSKQFFEGDNNYN